MYVRTERKIKEVLKSATRNENGELKKDRFLNTMIIGEVSVRMYEHGDSTKFDLCRNCRKDFEKFMGMDSK